MYRLCTGYPTTTVVKLVHHICTYMYDIPVHLYVMYVFNERKTVMTSRLRKTTLASCTQPGR